MSEIIVSSFGREGEKGFKYTKIDRDIVAENNLFGDLVDHWIRKYGWEEERDEIYPGEDYWFKGEREGREFRLKPEEDKLLVEYGIPTDYDHSQDYVDSVWEDQMFEILERNSEEELEDLHVVGKTLSNISDGRQKAV